MDEVDSKQQEEIDRLKKENLSQERQLLVIKILGIELVVIVMVCLVYSVWP